jgi:hypothetical protein
MFIAAILLFSWWKKVPGDAMAFMISLATAHAVDYFWTAIRTKKAGE